MRKSRLYLSLSIMSMIAAVVLGVAQGACGRGLGAVCGERSFQRNSVYAAFEARDFASMSRHAEALIADGDALNGHRLQAYALRGQGRLDEAIVAYHESMLRESGREVPAPVLVDAYVGLADCFNRMGLKDRARDWIDRAQQDATDQLKQRCDDGAHYQLACVLSVRSGIETGETSEILRAFAIKHLQLAIEAGFDSWEHMLADLDLDPLRSEARFQALFPH
ncbi:MAG: hypothetical protein K8I27_03125 [Planctomycetes bacterium]|nr:hypothetical protein [Planctomycetota bacterium]